MKASWLLVLIAAMSAQAQAPAFEVASIKPAPLERISFPYRMGPDFSMEGLLKHFIETAYEKDRYQVDGGPVWAESAWYDIQAKAPVQADASQIRAMLQTLLADRFQLKLHRETRMMSGYVLSVEKGGPKLPPVKSDAPAGSTGRIQLGGGIWMRGATIQMLSKGLWLQLGKPVLDETKIEGNYDVRLKFDDISPDLASPNATPGLGSVFGALHEIGLKLDAKKLPIEVLVIDSAERPSAN